MSLPMLPSLGALAQPTGAAPAPAEHIAEAAVVACVQPGLSAASSTPTYAAWRLHASLQLLGKGMQMLAQRRLGALLPATCLLLLHSIAC